jgi:hypothetical protein
VEGVYRHRSIFSFQLHAIVTHKSHTYSISAYALPPAATFNFVGSLQGGKRLHLFRRCILKTILLSLRSLDTARLIRHGINWSYYVVAVLHVGSPNAIAIKFVLQRKLKSGKACWFHANTVLPNKEHVDATVHKLFEETGLIMTTDDLTLLSGKDVRVPLHAARCIMSTCTMPMYPCLT